MDIFSKNEEDKDIFFKNGEKIRDWGYEDPPLVAPCQGHNVSSIQDFITQFYFLVEEE